MTDFHEEMAKKEAEWGEEKLRLRKGCVEVYEDGFMKAMRQAVLFAPEIDPMRFDIDKEVVDRQLLDDFDSEQWFYYCIKLLSFEQWICNYDNLLFYVIVLVAVWCGCCYLEYLAWAI